MSFIGVYRAIYDYAPQSHEELEVRDGDLLFVLEKSTEDDWWKCKKKAASDDDDEPEGLVPNNYIEEAQPSHSARALYDYTKQTNEELSFQEGASLDVYDQTDPDWTLVGSNGEYGFVPSIYIETSSAAAPAVAPVPPPMPTRPVAADEPIPGETDWRPEPAAASSSNPATALAGIIAQKTGGANASGESGPSTPRVLAEPPVPSYPRQQFTPEDSDQEEAPPPMPQRPPSQSIPSPPPTQYASPRSPESSGVLPSPPHNRSVAFAEGEDMNSRAGGYHLYNIHEMVTYMGKSKKMPTTLGINLAKGIIIISPEKSRDGPSHEWTAEKLTHYSIEGKHVFMELVRPSKSVDFHAGAKDTAREIVSQLGELAGASRAEGLREIIEASAGSGAEGMKKGKMLYEFMAQGDDEVTVAVDDDVIVLDDKKSEEWWVVRRLKNGKEGVVPSSYVEITGTIPRSTETINGLDTARSTVEQNRLEEQRLAKQAARRDKKADAIPERNSSLSSDQAQSRSQRSSQSKNKPNQSKMRTWTDRSGTFRVEAEFIGLRDNKIHLHKLNGVKIAVPVGKMAVEDLEYVEKVTGASLDEDKPLSDIKRRSTQRKQEDEQKRANGAGATIERKSEYDWFDFFLGCGVNPQICERYAAAFSRDQMGPEILPEVNEQLLRTLGLKEGDILRVMKHLDTQYGRQRDASQQSNGGGSLFSGEGGVLKNNTRKGRPAAPVQTNDMISEDAFKQDAQSPTESALPATAKSTPLASAPAREPKTGFEDDAWDVKPARTQTPVEPAKPAEPPRPVEPPKPTVNDDIASLAVSAPALQPVPSAPPPVQSPPPAASPPPSQQPSQPPGANQAIFDKIASLAPARQRPQPPPQQMTGNVPGMIAPPRPISAPGFQQPAQSAFAPPAQPLQQQYTGYQQPTYQQPLPQQQTGFQPGFPQQQLNGFMPPQNNVQAVQQNYPALQPQPTGLAFQPQSQFGAVQAAQQYGGFQQQPPYQQQLMNGTQTGSPFADPPRQPFQQVPSGLQYQQTAYQAQQPSFTMSQPTGINGFQAQPPPQLPPQQTGGVLGPVQPLVPQKTGPPPPVRFGVQPGANRLITQPTGRANLSKATPQNPFGF